MAKLRRGSLLDKAVKADALLFFVDRWTGQHRPTWAGMAHSLADLHPNDDIPTEPTHRTDTYWLRDNYFYVNKDGTLDKRFRRWVKKLK